MKLRTPFLALVIAAAGAFGLLCMSTAQAEIRTGFASINEIADPNYPLFPPLVVDEGRWFLWDVSRGSYYSSSYPSPSPLFYFTVFATLEKSGLGSFELLPATDSAAGSTVVEVQTFTAPLNLNELVDVNQTFSTANDAKIAGGEIKRFGYSITMPESPSPLYGWVELDGSASTIGNLVVNATWAYDTTGAPITVGTVPEPTTLTLVGLGCLVLFARYRFGRRQS